jgi:hypothetical protein
VKILGRGALLLTAGAFNLAWWVFAALLALFGFITSIKATTERLTLAWIQRSNSNAQGESLLTHKRRALSLRASGRRKALPDDKLREAIHS